MCYATSEKAGRSFCAKADARLKKRAIFRPQEKCGQNFCFFPEYTGELRIFVLRKN
jgi:hypothetical protein